MSTAVAGFIANVVARINIRLVTINIFLFIFIRLGKKGALLITNKFMNLKFILLILLSSQVMLSMTFTALSKPLN